MRKIACFCCLFVFLFLLSGCKNKTLPIKEEPAPEGTEYHITAELLTEEKALRVTTEIEYASPADDLSAIKCMMYPAAYEKSVVTEDKKAAAYPRGEVKTGGVELLSVQGDVPVADFDLGMENLLLTVRLQRKLKKGERVRLTIDQKVQLAYVKHRLGYYDGYFFLSDFYPAVCPYSDGKYLAYEYVPYGDPFRRETACFSLDLTFPLGVECASSAKETHREKQGTFETVSLRAEGAREIACVLSEKLRRYASERGSTRLFYYAANASDKERTFDQIKDALDVYEELFGAYPYEAFSLVVAPFFEAGVEHTGMALVSDKLSAAEKKRTILHEIAHQWWYGKVGNDEYASPWIDEGLAEYAVATYYSKSGSNAVCREMILDAMDAYSIRLALKGTDGVRFDRSLPELSDGYYDRVYAGGLLLFSALSQAVGEENFHAALRAFADRYEGEIPSSDDLIRALSSFLGKDCSSLFRAYLTGVIPLQ